MRKNIKVGGAVEFICGGVFFFVGIGLLVGAVIAFISNQNFKENASEQIPHLRTMAEDLSTYLGR
mgnify:CR=1 FL=1